ncbi:hypothetical protein HZS_3048 [Henneguya salminicola]|nr:hypothetical protein HZS_3048 [Henneguya salminicola]
MSSSIVFNNYSYGKKDASYYRCSKYKGGYKARLFKHGVTMTEKGVHTCGGKNVSVAIPVLTEKSFQLSLSSSQIFQDLILFLRERFVNAPYGIPSKSMIYSTMRNNRGLI